MSENHDRYIQIWSKVVDTQMHFNEMQVKSRQLGLTFVTAALGIAIVLLSNDDDFSFNLIVSERNFEIHVSVLLIFGAWLALIAVKQLDLNVYHRMLRGAVTFGMDFEQKYMKEIFELDNGMTQSISHFSRFEDAKVEKREDGTYRYVGSCKVTAQEKISQFYAWTQVFLAVAAIMLLIFTNLSSIDGNEDTIVGKSTNVSITNSLEANAQQMDQESKNTNNEQTPDL